MDKDNKNDNEYPKTIIQDTPYNDSTSAPEPSAVSADAKHTDQQQPNPVQPVDNVAQTSTPNGESTNKVDSPLQLVLQWLTYAFWGWTVLALSALTASVIASFVGDTDTGGFTPYGIAAVLVLLPISYFTDYFYSKNESSKKTGVSIAIMVIHAVIFALFGIGSLILAVIMVVIMLTNSGENVAAKTTLYSSLIVFTYYVATFLRTLNPPKFPFIKKFYKIFMIVSVGIIALMGILGPMAKERSRRQDKLITNNISDISYGVQGYTQSNGKLPKSLDEIDLKGDSKKLVEQGIVEYKPEGSDYSSSSSSRKSSSRFFKYQLCVVYKHESPGYKSTRYTTYSADDGYSSYINAYSHPSGEVCYKVSVTDY